MSDPLPNAPEWVKALLRGIGPRNSVVAAIQGRTYDALRDTSEWINANWMGWRDLPEMWVDRIHDFVGEEADDYEEKS